jgi:gluconolactonase
MASENPLFVVKQSSFNDIIGTNPSITICAESKDGTPLFHEACVYLPSISSLFVTSNIIADHTTGTQHVVVSKITVDTPHACHVEPISTSLTMANGGVNYKDGILFCQQGNLSHPSSLVYVHASSDGTSYSTQNVLSEFDGVPFNSLNDVVVAKDGAMWFTDPPYGSEQGFRGPPQLPAMVYRFDPDSGDVRAMADGFGRPNGLAFSPREDVLYVTVC